MLLSCTSEALILLNFNSKHPTKPGIVFSVLLFSELHVSVRFGEFLPSNRQNTKQRTWSQGTTWSKDHLYLTYRKCCIVGYCTKPQLDFLWLPQAWTFKTITKETHNLFCIRSEVVVQFYISQGLFLHIRSSASGLAIEITLFR